MLIRNGGIYTLSDLGVTSQYAEEVCIYTHMYVMVLSHSGHGISKCCLEKL